MKKYYLLFIALFFTACMDSAKPVVLDKDFTRYGPIQNSCLNIIQDVSPHCEEKHCEILPQECKEFIEVLDAANQAVQHMNINKNNATFYVAKEKYKNAKTRLKIKHKHLNLILKDKALDAIDEDDLVQFTKIINFSYHPMNLRYYNYMKRNMPHFKNTKKFYYFEKKYALQKYKQGYKLVNKGKYTQGLAHLEVSSQMNNVDAARLCGDVFVYIYPSKAKSCYEKGVELGNTHMMFLLANEYEKYNKLDKAYEWYQKSADAGNYISQYKLYTLNKSKNLNWLIRSADSGYDKAQYDYGMHLYKNKENSQSQKYLLSAAKQGYESAYYPLGVLYFSKKEYKKAYAYLSKGAENADSMYKLGFLHEYAKGTQKNYYAASRYYTKAKSLGKSGIQKDINRVKKSKSRMRSAYAKKQKILAEQGYEERKAQARRRESVRQKYKRIQDQWNSQKEDSRRLRAQACGDEPTSSNLKVQGSRIHLQGTLTHWLGKSAFIVAAGAKEYYVKDKDDLAKLNKGDSVNMVGVTTGTREITKGLRKSLFEEADETAIEKAYALDYEGVCPY